jgi:hypothetical protein
MRSTQSTRPPPHEPRPRLQTTRHDAASAASHHIKIAVCAVRLPTSLRPELRELRMEVARSDEQLRGSRATDVVTEKTPEASLSREGSHGSIDSPGRLTRRAPRLLKRRPAHSCGAAPVSHRLPQTNPNAHYLHYQRSQPAFTSAILTVELVEEERFHTTCCGRATVWNYR